MEFGVGISQRLSEEVGGGVEFFSTEVLGVRYKITFVADWQIIFNSYNQLVKALGQRREAKA